MYFIFQDQKTSTIISYFDEISNIQQKTPPNEKNFAEEVEFPSEILEIEPPFPFNEIGSVTTTSNVALKVESQQFSINLASISQSYDRMNTFPNSSPAKGNTNFGTFGKISMHEHRLLNLSGNESFEITPDQMPVSEVGSFFSRR